MSDLAISGSIRRHYGKLFVNYELFGPIMKIAIPSRSEKPARRRNLWDETCFEFFVGSDNSNGYWEFNLSPSGNWNVYHFKSYRQDMREETSFVELPFGVSLEQMALRLSAEVDLQKIICSDEKTLRIGICAIVKDMKNIITYWALSHPGTSPDFHDNNGFTLKL